MKKIPDSDIKTDPKVLADIANLKKELKQSNSNIAILQRLITQCNKENRTLRSKITDLNHQIIQLTRRKS